MTPVFKCTHKSLRKLLYNKNQIHIWLDCFLSLTVHTVGKASLDLSYYTLITLFGLQGDGSLMPLSVQWQLHFYDSIFT